MIRLVASDLDGTLLPHNGSFHPNDVDTLYQLGKMGVIRVIATGRSLNSAQRSLPDDFPIDYLVFSSGAGVYCWREKKMLKQANLGFDNAQRVVNLLKERNVAFTLHQPIPENHHFSYWAGSKPHPDFQRYIQFHQPNALPLNDLVVMDYAQILGFVSYKEEFDELASNVRQIKTVRATSPLDGRSIWMEFLHPEVSKAEGVRFVCQQLNIADNQVAVMGNDFNDVDLLTAFDNAYVVDNAPNELKEIFTVLPAVNNRPLYHLHLALNFPAFL